MASGRIRRTARRGIVAAVLGWLGVAVTAVVMAPGASAADSATVRIDDVTPPAVSVDADGTVTFVNAIGPDTVSVRLPIVGGASATVHRDVAVTFFGDKRSLATGRSTSWTFPKTTTGSITYTVRIVPESGLTTAVADQVVKAVKATLKDGGAPVTVPYVVQTILPDLPNLPSVNVPELPSVEVPDLPVDAPVGGGDDTNGGDTGGGGTAERPAPLDAEQYTYGDGGAAPQMQATDSGADRAFDPSRFRSTGGSAGAGDGGTGSGSGGLAGSYDGASVPVFGRLDGMNGIGGDAGEELAGSAATAPALPAAALAAVIAMATATAALVRTHQARRSSRR
jgi:hypothetical protein